MTHLSPGPHWHCIGPLWLAAGTFRHDLLHYLCKKAVRGHPFLQPQRYTNELRLSRSVETTVA